MPTLETFPYFNHGGVQKAEQLAREWAGVVTGILGGSTPYGRKARRPEPPRNPTKRAARKRVKRSRRQNRRK